MTKQQLIVEKSKASSGCSRLPPKEVSGFSFRTTPFNINKTFAPLGGVASLTDRIGWLEPFGAFLMKLSDQSVDSFRRQGKGDILVLY